MKLELIISYLFHKDFNDIMLLFLEGHLEKGGFGDVFLCTSSKGYANKFASKIIARNAGYANRFAAKVIAKNRISQWIHKQPSEIFIHRRVGFVKGIIEFYLAYETTYNYILILDKPEGYCDLFDVVEKEGRFSESTCRTIFKQLLCVVSFFLSMSICHVFL